MVAIEGCWKARSATNDDLQGPGAALLQAGSIGGSYLILASNAFE